MLVRRHEDIDRQRALEALDRKLHRQAEEIAELAEERMLDIRVPLPTPEELLGDKTHG